MGDSLLQITQMFFENLQKLPKGREELIKFDKVVEFDIPDDAPFTLEIKGGVAAIRPGISDPADMNCVRLRVHKDVMTRLLTCRMRFTDAYTHMSDRDPNKMKQHLYVREQLGLGGTDGGVLVRWVGRLIRIGQELS